MAVELKKTVSVLGSTGSIGRTTLALLNNRNSSYKIEAITGGGNWELLAEQARKFQPNFVAISEVEHLGNLQDALKDLDIQIAAGPEGLIEAAKRPAEWVMAGIVGTAGLPSTIEAVRRGTTVAFANKECLVSAGTIMMREVEKARATLLPVDSEHNAIFQVFENNNKDMVDRIILTASGGPFRNCTPSEMTTKTPEQAIAHPNWQMGAKISVDSATMMNKGLEIIEAHYLFGIPEDRIEVLVHPESIVHSLVAYKDGSVLAQLGMPDMSIPIANALAWPQRIKVEGKSLDLSEIGRLSFEPPDMNRFPAIRLAREALRFGGTAPLILNAANEVAVEGFLAGTIRFTDIVKVVEKALERGPNQLLENIESVLETDQLVRVLAKEIIQEHGLNRISGQPETLSLSQVSV